MALHKVSEGIFTSSAKLARKARREAEVAREYAEAFLSGDWPRWDEEEGKWDL